VNATLIGELVRLRYKLLWAKTRSRNGRIALFVIGYLLFTAVAAIFSLGGFGAGMVAVKSGKGEALAQALLGGLFVQAILSANILGFGMSAVFADSELRRYPLTATDRRMARHLTGILDPFWFLFLVLDVALAFGMYVMGVGNFWMGLAGVLTMFVANYLAARIVAEFVDRLMKSKGGTPVLLLLVISLAMLPSAIGTAGPKALQIATGLLQRFWFTPPFGAAAAIIHADATGLAGVAINLIWIAALGLLLIALESRPATRQASAAVEVHWDSRFDRAGALFGPELGPLVGHWLRFYLRNGRTRALLAISLPLAAFLTYQAGHVSKSPHRLFVTALGSVSLLTFFGVSRIMVNQFGYVGGAFRRYFLLPVKPDAILRSASYAGLLIGAAMAPLGVIAFAAVVPDGRDPRALLMLLSTAFSGMFLLHGLGVWVTLYNPRKGNYNSTFGNDLSLGGNILLIGGMMTALILPNVVYHFARGLVAMDAWWGYPALPVLACAFYVSSLRAAGSRFAGRRERVLAIVEGRD
jgi:hypothetical protein